MNDKYVQHGKESPEPVIFDRGIHIDDQNFLDYPTDPGLLYWVNNATFEGRVAQTFGNDLPGDRDIRHVLEVGCSWGTTTGELRRAYPCAHITAVDSNSAILEYVKEYQLTDVRLVHGDGYFPQRFCEPGSVDIAFMMNNIAHVAQGMEAQQLAGILRNYLAILRPGGYLLVSSDDAYMVASTDGSSFRVERQKLASTKNVNNPKNIEAIIGALAIV